MRHPALDEALACALTLKVETLNPIRSFKGRGTEAVLASLAPRPAAVITASSGDFGQGIAWAAWRRGIAATIFAMSTRRWELTDAGLPVDSSHGSRGCSQDALKGTGGAGLFYCFAAD